MSATVGDEPHRIYRIVCIIIAVLPCFSSSASCVFCLLFAACTGSDGARFRSELLPFEIIDSEYDAHTGSPLFTWHDELHARILRALVLRMHDDDDIGGAQLVFVRVRRRGGRIVGGGLRCRRR